MKRFGGYGVGGRIWWVLTKEALFNLRAQGRRSLLALLGVMIGSASIVAMMSFAHIARTEVMVRFQQIGVDVVQLGVEHSAERWIGASELATAVDDEGVVSVAGLSAYRVMVGLGREVTATEVVGMGPDAWRALNLDVEKGRPISAVDGCNGAAILGHELAKAHRAELGSWVIINGYGYWVGGILRPYSDQAMSPIQPNQSVIIGTSCARRVMPHEGYSVIMVRLAPSVDSLKWGQALQKKLSRDDRPLILKTPREMIAAMEAQVRLMGAVLLAIGGVSLLVGGVGVMNVMLMSVMERRREIGLRAAIGATPSEIVFIFLIESIVLSVGGGILGGLIGMGLTALGCVFLPFSFAFDPMVVVWGPGISAITGLVFGLQPAIAASRIIPVEALRAD